MTHTAECLQCKYCCKSSGKSKIFDSGKRQWRTPKTEEFISPKVWKLWPEFQKQTWKKISLNDSNNNRQPEMATETGNTYICETMTDSIEIPTVILRFTTTKRSKKVAASDCNSDRQPKIAIWPPNSEVHIHVSLDLWPTVNPVLLTMASSIKVSPSNWIPRRLRQWPSTKKRHYSSFWRQYCYVRLFVVVGNIILSEL